LSSSSSSTYLSWFMEGRFAFLSPNTGETRIYLCSLLF
jgi:hypothetical protein